MLTRKTLERQLDTFWSHQEEFWHGRATESRRQVAVRVYGRPTSIVSNIGTEFTSRTILKWANENGVDWRCIDPGKPQLNALSGSFKGGFWEELLIREKLHSLEDARRKLALRRYENNNVRLHQSLGNKHRSRRAGSLSYPAAMSLACLPNKRTRNRKIRPSDSRCD